MKNVLKILAVVFLVGGGLAACSDASSSEGNYFEEFYNHGVVRSRALYTVKLVDGTYCVMIDHNIQCDFSERLK